MDNETIKLILDLGGSSASVEEVRRKLDELKASASGVADTYQVLATSGQGYEIQERQIASALDKEVEAAVEATRAQKILAEAFEEVNTKSVGFGNISRENSQRILEFGRAAQDFAQGGLAGVINNIERLVGGGGVAAGLLTVLGTVLLLTKDTWMGWLKAFEEGKQKIPEASDEIDKLTENLKKNKDALEELKKQQTLSFFELEKYRELVGKVKEEEKAIADARKLQALDQAQTKDERERAGQFTEALAEFGGAGKLIEAITATGLPPERAREMILGAARGERLETGNIRRTVPAFSGLMPLDPIQMRQREDQAKRAREGLKDEEEFGRQREARRREAERLNQAGQDNQIRMQAEAERSRLNDIRASQQDNRAISRAFAQQRNRPGVNLNPLPLIPQNADPAEVNRIILDSQMRMQGNAEAARRELRQIARQINQRVRNMGTGGLP